MGMCKRGTDQRILYQKENIVIGFDDNCKKVTKIRKHTKIHKLINNNENTKPECQIIRKEIKQICKWKTDYRMKAKKGRKKLQNKGIKSSTKK